MIRSTPSAEARRIRILIADDSAVMRGLLRMVLEPQPDLEVAVAVADGREALAALERLRPDLALLDIEMPGMNGLEVLSAIRARDSRLPVIMCSTLTSRGARITIEALARGATDYVAKPASQSGLRQGVETLTRELVPKIKALVPRYARPMVPPPMAAASFPAAAVPPRVVVIGVSTGGPAALERIVPKFPADFSVPILIVQHMPRLFTAMLAERLNDLSSLHVHEAADGACPQPGTIQIAPGDWHMELGSDFRLHLGKGEPENFCRPSVDVLFRSAARACSGRVLATILTGMGSDGLAGCRAIRAAGGTVFAQDSATSSIWGMPGAVVSAGLAHKVLPLDAIPGEIVRVVASASRSSPDRKAARL